MTLRCVVYVSTARSRLAEDEVRAIVAASQRNNARDGITGLLLFNGSNFLQLIEGDEEPLGRLMRRLIADERHGGIVRLADRPVANAACTGWSMQPVGIGLDQPQRATCVAEALPLGLPGDLRQMILSFAQLN